MRNTHNNVEEKLEPGYRQTRHRHRHHKTGNNHAVGGETVACGGLEEEGLVMQWCFGSQAEFLL